MVGDKIVIKSNKYRKEVGNNKKVSKNNKKIKYTKNVKWVRPHNGKVSKEFSYSDVGKKGIDISGVLGDNIYSTGDVGDLTYPYKVLSNSTKTIKEICENKHEVSDKIINAKKPIVIIGQSALKLKSGKYIFENIKNFLISKKKISDEWN